MSAAHTPGPWVANFGDGAGYDTLSAGHEIMSADGKQFVGIDEGDDYEGPDDPQFFADARLIAAAPDLLAALEFALRDMEGARAQFASHTPNVGILVVSIGIARAAIAKARGQS